MAKKDEEQYNPFTEQDEGDLSFLFGEEEKSNQLGEDTEKEEKEEKPESLTLEKALENLPDEQSKPIRDAFSQLATQIEELTKKPSMDQGEIVQALLQLQSGSKPRQEAEEDTSDKEVLTVLKELGMDVEDEGKASKLVKAIEKISERRARNIYDPYVKAVSARFAREERSMLSQKYPQKDSSGKDTGYPSLDSCAKEVKAVLDKHPTLDLVEAYEWANRDAIYGQGGKSKSKENGPLTAKDILRKIGASSDKPSSTTSQSVRKTGQAKTIREAAIMAAKELGMT